MKFDERKVNIYSRPRILFSNFNNTSHNQIKKANRKNHLKGIILYKVMVVIFIATITAICIVNFINPIIDQISINEVQNKVIRITNNEAQKIMKDYQYDDLVTVVTDNDKNISMIQANTNNINTVASAISMNIVDSLKENTNSKIRIYLGSLFGMTLLSGTGPRITVRISNTGNVNTSLKSEFSSAGINQTLHRIYLEINMNVSILTPYHSINSNVKSQVLLGESIIVGNVPASYYYLNNGETIEPSDIMN